MEDILNMSPWDFFDVCSTMAENVKRMSGKTIHKPLNKMSKDMIARAKGLKNG